MKLGHANRLGIPMTMCISTQNCMGADEATSTSSPTDTTPYGGRNCHKFEGNANGDASSERSISGEYIGIATEGSGSDSLEELLA